MAKALSYQVLKCGTSVGSNYEEADDDSSDRDTLAKRKIALFLTNAQDPVIDESDELVKILATLVNKHPDGK